MKINEVEKETGITTANIRYYEKKDLLAPKRSDDNNYRLYNTDDIERLKQIKMLRMMGVPIADVKKLLDGDADLKTIMLERVEQLSEEEKNIATIKNLCQTVAECDMDMDMLNEQLLGENMELWKKKLEKVNLEEKAQHLCRKTGIILCALSLLLCFAPLVPYENRTLNIIQLVLHPNFSWNFVSILFLIPYLLMIVVYAHILFNQLNGKYSVDVIFLSNMAMRLTTVLQCGIIGLSGYFIPNISSTSFTGTPMTLCIIIILLRMLIAFLVVICYSSGDEFFVRILRKE